jgi:hypothetical protein
MWVVYPYTLLDSSFDGSGRVLHLMPSKEGMYSDLFSAWIVRRPVLPGKDNLGSQMLFKGSELDSEKSLGFFDDRIREALKRMEPFEDGGILPLNDPRMKGVST